MPVTLPPGPNGELLKGTRCDFARDHMAIVPFAVADAQMVEGPYKGAWGYLCMDHLEKYGTRNPQLINNILTEPLEIKWIRS